MYSIMDLRELLHDYPSICKKAPKILQLGKFNAFKEYQSTLITRGGENLFQIRINKTDEIRKRLHIVAVNVNNLAITSIQGFGRVYAYPNQGLEI